jgi:two-component system, NtrC family, sensor kinase
MPCPEHHGAAMRQRDKAAKTRRRKSLTLKRRDASKALRRHDFSPASEEKNVARLSRELSEAFEQQAATSDILNIISNSPTDAQPVFDAIVQSGLKLFPDALISLALRYGDTINAAAIAERDPEGAEAWRRSISRTPLSREYMHGAAMLDCKIVDIPDVGNAPAELAAGARNFLTSGYRAITITPMMRRNVAIGLLSVVRRMPGPLSDKQLSLLRTFAAQAVIAIENTRLLNELRQRTDDLSESLEQQTATSEVLKVISGSPTDIQPVLDAVGENAARLCEANNAVIFRLEGNFLRHVASYGHIPTTSHPIDGLPVSRDTVTGRAVFERRTIHVHDLSVEDREYPEGSEHAKVDGHRTTLATPLLREGVPVGAILIRRMEVHPFSPKQIELVTTFADQAAIAIENVRLFNELRESLQQQTATSEVLKVISSSPGELEPVFRTMLENATNLCGAQFGNMYLRRGDAFELAATHNTPPDFAEERKRTPYRLDRGKSPTNQMVRTKSVIHVADLRLHESYVSRDPRAVAGAELGGIRSLLLVPMLNEGEVVGYFAIYRQEVRPFTDKQVELLSNFAAQAVIAIENTRLLNELRESLQQQTATADVLKVISRSTFDLQTVLDTLVESAARLCGAEMANIWRPRDGAYRLTASYGVTARYKESLENKEFLNTIAIEPGRGTTVGRVLLERKSVHIHDIQADPDYKLSGLVALGGTRTMLGIPMLREGDPIGVLVLVQSAVRPFTDKQIELATTFADQAVIAIENVRLFEEVQARTRELAQSVDELQALGEVSQAVNSTLELETVLTTIVSRAVQLSRTDAGTIYVFDEACQEFCLHATYGMSEAMIAAITDQHIGLGDSNIGAATTQRKPVQVPDIRNQPSPVNEIILREGYRGILIIPLLRPDHIVGALVVRRKTPGEFPQSTIDLLQTFADQSAVAVQNARLYENVEARTRELVKSLEDLRTTQDRLVQTQKLASLGQLTAGIAHEIKNPLNFVNNFSGVSAELIDELQEALKDVNLNEKRRKEINELTNMLRGNLDKVMQHGKRADAIVKNMLLHSREGSGEHRPVDINVLVEEGLNLAYHGARAEKQGFNITLQKSFDPTVGEADVFPQDITRVLLNLILNGFYAATKRRAEINSGDYEPTLAAATKNLGDRVEIRIRDNGTGISPEVKEKIFNPFFTTKPAGEGTGLGLSISHDIIVKQHGGSIEVDTQPGEFTEIRIILPRTAVFL